MGTIVRYVLQLLSVPGREVSESCWIWSWFFFGGIKEGLSGGFLKSGHGKTYIWTPWLWRWKNGGKFWIWQGIFQCCIKKERPYFQARNIGKNFPWKNDLHLSFASIMSRIFHGNKILFSQKRCHNEWRDQNNTSSPRYLMAEAEG